MVKLTFAGSTIDTASYYWGTARVSCIGASSEVSDTAGHVLFYSNGSQVANSLTQIMDYGDTLTDPLFYGAFPGGFNEGQTNIILPRSGSTFYLFYYSQSDSLFATQTIPEPDRLEYAIVDMSANGGLGRVVSKKNVAYKGIFGDCRLTACRHANGRDWWLVHQGLQSDEYFVYLVTPDSISMPRIQHIGPSGFYDDLYAQSCFSADGSRFATIALMSPLVLMDFDRCTGTFSNPQFIPIPQDTFWYNGTLSGIYGQGGTACCFSPGGRYLYMSDAMYIRQYDISAANIVQSGVVAGGWDTVGPVGGDYGLNQMYLLPDGKIIISDVQGAGSDFHLIDSPDIGGLGCHFHLNGLPTSTLNANTLPNMINYRLGALNGAGCDTLLGMGELPTSGIDAKVYPIPASEMIHIEIAAEDISGPVCFVLYDMMGREIMRKDIRQYQTTLRREGTASGIYRWLIQAPDGINKTTGKLIWE